jgi:dTDP-4-dehydrorhamnose reductase
MRMMITGAGGQVGRHMAEFCRTAGDEVIAADHATLDVTDRDAVLRALDGTRPDVVLHAAAWTAVDACESDPDRAFAVNALASRHVSEASAQIGAHLVYISTDYVFDGTLDRPYNEWDTPNPQSVYGRSKLAGEIEVARVRGDATLVRISWVCGLFGNNMVKTVLRLAKNHESLAFVNDQRGHPTIVGDLVPVLRRLAAERRPGTYHVTNQGVVTWFDFAREVFSAAGLDAGRIRPICTADLDPRRPAPRPQNSVLDNAALRLSGLEPLPDFRPSLHRLVTALADQ